MKDLIYNDWVEKLPSLEHKAVAITGTTSGTGYWAAVAAIRKNVSLLVLLNRKSSRASEAETRIKAEASRIKSGTVVVTVNCDLMKFESVHNAARHVIDLVKEYGGLDVLINNAGIMAFPDDRTDDGYDVQIQTNHLSHFLLTKLLLGSLQAAVNSRGEARIVQHSSGARNIGGGLKIQYFQKSQPNTLGGNDPKALMRRYHMTKLANTCFAMRLHQLLVQKNMVGIKSTVAEPGYSKTELVSNVKKSHKPYHLLTRARVLLMDLYFRFFVPGQSAADGACPLIEASFGSNTESGDFFVPKNGSVGPPVKAISQGIPVPPYKERKTMDEANQSLLWQASEQAIGSQFLSKL
mmetsp:Transcript_15856/g.17902  ORF Transcript_15856/g.17902 Transcript_15856/m.17902 type:complete len:351 (-) Transcript_15856:50-1102(-)